MTRISVPNPEHFLRVGMVAEATIRGDRTVAHDDAAGRCDGARSAGRDAGLRLLPRPEACVREACRNRFRESARTVEIKSGLSGDELIVLAGQTKLERRSGRIRRPSRRSAEKCRPGEERPHEPDQVFASLSRRDPHIDGHDRHRRHPRLPENATDGRSDDHHQNRNRGRDLPGSDLRAGGKTGHEDPRKAHLQVPRGAEGKDLFHEPSRRGRSSTSNWRTTSRTPTSSGRSCATR